MAVQRVAARVSPEAARALRIAKHLVSGFLYTCDQDGREDDDCAFKTVEISPCNVHKLKTL